MKRTSTSHPLQIAALEVGDGRGRIGVTFCPGKKDGNALTGAWDRDLGLDLDAVKAWGAAALVTLIEAHEFRLLGVEALGEETTRRGLLWLHLPIKDVSTPGPGFERQWSTEGPRLHGLLQAGRSVVVHCRGGLGRAGTIAARLLVESGWTPAKAIQTVRKVRPGAIETREQEDYVRAL